MDPSAVIVQGRQFQEPRTFKGLALGTMRVLCSPCEPLSLESHRTKKTSQLPLSVRHGGLPRLGKVLELWECLIEPVISQSRDAHLFSSAVRLGDLKRRRCGNETSTANLRDDPIRKKMTPCQKATSTQLFTVTQSSLCKSGRECLALQ